MNDIFSTAKAYSAVVSGATADEQKKKAVAVNEPRLQSVDFGGCSQ
jgi:hypothetical protein